MPVQICYGIISNNIKIIKYGQNSIITNTICLNNKDFNYVTKNTIIIARYSLMRY